VQPEAIEATFEDGVLEVTIPKPVAPEEPKPVKVAIK
jgi:HSP20 family molecular chaperone IbpA